MTDNSRVRIVCDEDPEIVARLDTIARREKLSRSDVVRRAVRQYLFILPVNPNFEESPEVDIVASEHA